MKGVSGPSDLGFEAPKGLAPDDACKAFGLAKDVAAPASFNATAHR